MDKDDIEIHQVSDEKFTVVIKQLQADGKANDFIKFVSHIQMPLQKAVEVRDKLLEDLHHES